MKQNQIQDLPGEHWKRVPGYDAYEVSSHGRVLSWRSDKARLLSRYKAYNRLRVTLFADGKPRLWTVAVLMWLAFRGSIPKGHRVMFKDGDFTNLTIDNLELWDGYAFRCWIIGQSYMHTRGTRHHNATLTEEQAAKLVVRLRNRNESLNAIAAEVGISPQQLSKIRKGKGWGHLSHIESINQGYRDSHLQHNRWTQRENDYLIRHYNRCSLQRIVDGLGRTPKAIIAQAMKLRKAGFPVKKLDREAVSRVAVEAKRLNRGQPPW